jgi:hypothetical protein
MLEWGQLPSSKGAMVMRFSLLHGLLFVTVSSIWFGITRWVFVWDLSSHPTQNPPIALLMAFLCSTIILLVFGASTVGLFIGCGAVAEIIQDVLRRKK